MTDQNIYFEMFGACVDFGWNALENLPEHIAQFDTKKALIVTDGGVASLGIPKKHDKVVFKKFSSLKQTFINI